MAKLKSINFQCGFGSGNGKPPTRDELAEIYDTYYLPIYRFVFRQIGDVELSRELSSDVFCRLLQAVKKDTEILQRLAPWLFRTARNIVIDHFRRQQHRNHLSIHEETLKSSHNTVEVADQSMSAHLVRKALQKLTPDQRQVILLKFMEGLSNQEVAELLSKPVGAVKALQHRALSTLRELLIPIEERESYENRYARNPECCY